MQRRAMAAPPPLLPPPRRRGAPPLRSPLPPPRSPPPPPRAFVGDATTTATEYHDADFDWDAWAADATPLLEAALARRAAEAATAAASAPPAAVLPPPGPPPGPPLAPWDAFHARDNATSKFYKQRRYLALAFPDAVAPTVRHIVELGAGAGSSLLPLLAAAPPTATALATDVSPPAVALCDAAASAAGVASRVRTAVLDAASPAAPAALAGEAADVCVLVFALGALAPDDHGAALAAAAAALRPGGRLLFRDHGVFDVTQLRGPRLVARVPPGGGARAPALHARADGTLCFFFTPAYVAAAAARAGLASVECRYVTIERPNRKTGAVLRRVFVHGVFEKRAGEGDEKRAGEGEEGGR